MPNANISYCGDSSTTISRSLWPPIASYASDLFGILGSYFPIDFTHVSLLHSLNAYSVVCVPLYGLSYSHKTFEESDYI